VTTRHILREDVNEDARPGSFERSLQVTGLGLGGDHRSSPPPPAATAPANAGVSPPDDDPYALDEDIDAPAATVSVRAARRRFESREELYEGVQGDDGTSNGGARVLDQPPPNQRPEDEYRRLRAHFQSLRGLRARGPAPRRLGRARARAPR
jgi:hypothetical protein